MSKLRLPGAVALLGLLAGAAANADDHRYYRPEPQVRFAIDVIWGGYGHTPPLPPVAWYPYLYVPAPRYYDRGYGPGYGRGYRQGCKHGYRHGEGRGRRKHEHRAHRWDDSDQ